MDGWRRGMETKNDHWLYGSVRHPGFTGIVRLKGDWHIWCRAQPSWKPYPEYNHLSADEMKAMAIVMNKMGG